jgi:hypothetical protein
MGPIGKVGWRVPSNALELICAGPGPVAERKQGRTGSQIQISLTHSVD